MLEPRLLVLRIWPASCPFRAVVRTFEPERSHQFDEPQALIDFVLMGEPARQHVAAGSAAAATPVRGTGE